jgi:hypothetical protein
MLTRRHPNVVACALANKLARTAWALATRHSTFDAGSAAPASGFTEVYPSGFAIAEI